MTTASPARRSITSPKVAAKRPIRLQTYTIVARAVEEGIADGFHRYLKYGADGVDVDSASEHIERGVLNRLCEVVRFDDEEM